MYERVKAALLSLLKVPLEPLDPMGDVKSLRVFRAAPGYWRYVTLSWLLSQVALLAAIFAFPVPRFIAGPGSWLPIWVVIGLAVLAVVGFLVEAGLTYFSLRLDFEMRWYKITDRSLRIRSGVWNVDEVTMTFANIQNITITQGPLERLFGISDVRVDTAGGGGSARARGHRHGRRLGANPHVGIFRGVDNPGEIRDLMLTRLRRLRDTGLGDIDEQRSVAPTRAVDAGLPVEMLAGLAALRDEAAALRKAAEAVALPVHGSEPKR